MFKTLLANLDGMVYRCRDDADWTMEFVSEGCTRLTGYAPEDLLLNGRLSYEELTHPDDRQRVRDTIHAAVAEDRRFHVEYRIQHADGRARWVWEHGGGVRDASGRVVAIEGIVEDITARVESEQALREAERRYRSLFDNAIEGIFRTTPDGRYLDANPALARIYGFATPQELVESLRDIKSQLYVDAGRREEFMRIIKTRGEISGFESRVYRKNGDVIWISENARAVFDDEGRVLHYEGTVEDITERRQNQARIEQQANYDSLTGLANRSLLNDRLQQAIYSAASYGARLAVVFVDLDRFKYINDTLGHDVGDRLLQVMAERFTSAVAASDTVARLGGDEFVLLLHGQAGPDTVTTILERLLPTISAPLALRAERSRGHVQHRCGALSRRRQRPCDAAEARRLGDVSREGAGPQQLPVLHRGSESGDQGAVRSREPAAARARSRPVRAVLPAARRHAHRARSSAPRR